MEKKIGKQICEKLASNWYWNMSEKKNLKNTEKDTEKKDLNIKLEIIFSWDRFQAYQKWQRK